MKWDEMRAFALRVIAAGVLFVVYPVVGAIYAEPGSIPYGAVTCEGFVYTVDPDPEGTNIRSAPQKGAPVLRKIPHDPEGTVVELSASSGNWVLIHSAEGVTNEFEFHGEGWVHSSLLAVRAVHPTGRKVPLYSEPDTASPVITMITGEKETRLAGCKGRWMLVKYGKEKGWLARGDYCGNPVTTCP
ncbi:MAG: SH3 domain-containing protein [Syntrophobacteraceae bacterium]